MDEDMFNELVASVKEGMAIMREEVEPSRVFHYPSCDVQTIRKSFKLSQREFALMLGISVNTLQNWEQGRREPSGTARVLLEVAATHPEALLDTVKKIPSQPCE
jgi:putative transcriptional regulator